MIQMADNFEIRAARPGEVPEIQSLEEAVWKKGAYRFYGELYELSREGILVAANEKLLGYVAAERIGREALGVGMPSWNHDPRGWHKPDGDVLYIVNHTISREADSQGIERAYLSDVLMERFLALAEKSGTASMAAVIYWLRHTRVRNPRRLWGRHGFAPLPHTYDPDWGPYEGEEETGAIVWAREIGD